MYKEYTGAVHKQPILNEQMSRFIDIFRRVVLSHNKKARFLLTYLFRPVEEENPNKFITI